MAQKNHNQRGVHPNSRQMIVIRPSKTAKWSAVSEPGSRMWELERLARPYDLAGAGRDSSKALCLGSDGGLLCVKDARPGSDFCYDHKHLKPWPKPPKEGRRLFRDAKGRLYPEEQLWRRGDEDV